MIIYNTDTKTEETISYISNGQDMSQELALSSDQIKYNKEEDRYEASDEEIRYWEDWFEKTTFADDMENDLKEIVRDLERTDDWRSILWILREIELLYGEFAYKEHANLPLARQRAYKLLYKKIQKWWNEGLEKENRIEGYWRLEEN